MRLNEPPDPSPPGDPADLMPAVYDELRRAITSSRSSVSPAKNRIDEEAPRRARSRRPAIGGYRRV